MNRAIDKQDTFSRVRHIFTYDEGRGVARNAGMAQFPDADWYLFLDADDVLHVDAMNNFMQERDCVFGLTTSMDPDRQRWQNIEPKTWEDLVTGSPVGLIDWGFFRGEPARKVGFMDVDTWDDYEFWLAMASEFSWTKAWYPIRIIRPGHTSSEGPRGYSVLDWQKAVAPIRAHWEGRGRVPMTVEERHELARRIGPRPGVRRESPHIGSWVRGHGEHGGPGTTTSGS